jgi:hypothetical protein
MSTGKGDGVSKSKRPANPTKYQAILWMLEEGTGAILFEGYPCPKKGGPQNKIPGRPGLIGFPAENGFCACSGCAHWLGSYFEGYACEHPGARHVAAVELQRIINEYEARNKPPLQAALL